MPRIRSLHPGQWSDEDFVSLSYPARLLALALRNIADDQGVFEWKPLTLKMQLFPADAVDVGDLLAELLERRQVRQYEVEGRIYGAIRNFTTWQRPKKPVLAHPVTDEVRDYVGVKPPESGTEDASPPPSSPPVPHSTPTGGEVSPQRKEEGGGRKDVGGKKKEEGDAAGAAPPAGRYAFEATTIKLSAPHLEEWRKAYPSLRLEAELFALDEWAGTKGKSWFSAVSTALRNKQRQADDRTSERKERLLMEATKPPSRPAPDPRI